MTKTIKINETTSLSVKMYNTSIVKKWFGAWKHFHKVVVFNADGVKKYFTFHDNSAKVNADELLEVLECILDDGLSGSYSFKDFGEQLGYGYENLAEWRHAYNGCTHTYNSLLALGLTLDDICDALNIIANITEEDRLGLAF